MALRIRRGTDAQRSGVTFEMGEIVWTTDGQQLFVGDGLAQGGTAVIGAQILGYGLAYDSLNKRIEVAGLTSDDVAEGSNRLYHTTERAVDAVGAALVAGNLTNVGITFTYSQTQDDAGRINATVALDGVGITEVADDTSPSLGGNLDLAENDITGLGSIDITGNITASGTIGNDIITITGNVITSTNSLDIESTNSSTRLDIGTPANPNTLWISSDKLFTVATGLTTGENASGHSSRISRGTLAVPTAVQAGDFVSYFEGFGFDGTEYVQAGAFGLAVNLSGTVSTGSVPGIFGVILPNSTGVATLTFDNQGVLNVPIFKATGYATGSLPTAGAPDEGFIVFDSTTKQFKGWNGTAWVVL
jgi:Major tropism determinant N-terminal domain